MGPCGLGSAKAFLGRPPNAESAEGRHRTLDSLSITNAVYVKGHHRGTELQLGDGGW